MLQSHCSLAIGIDIGGTTSRAALVDNRGTIVESLRGPTPVRYEEWLHWLVATVTRWAQGLASSNNTPISIGLALPGVVDPAKGTVIRSVNLPWLEGRAIADQLERKIGSRPVIMTDAEAATWGEYIDFGSPATPFAHLRLGTGIACGVVVNGQLIQTDPARRTHLPILIVDQSQTAPKCPCGLRGCLELFVSGISLVRMASEFGLDRALDGLRASYESGDERMIDLLDRAASAVARAVENLAKTYDVEQAVLGGGVLEALPFLFPLIQQTSESPIPIQLSRLKDDAGIIGAARFADLSETLRI